MIAIDASAISGRSPMPPASISSLRTHPAEPITSTGPGNQAPSSRI
jgi:hypothetical protein